jgi:NDP-mannose synthase
VEAIIMAGGRGTRLAPYTTVLPKPLMPLCDRPILDVLLRQLVRDGVERVTISVSPLSGLIETWVRHHGHYGIPVGFVYEDEPLGTAGALGNVERPEATFLALNGDVLTTLDFRALIRIHQEAGNDLTIATHQRTVRTDYGVLHTDGAVGATHRVTGYDEKPELSYTVSMGVYVLEASVVELLQPGVRCDFPDLVLALLEQGAAVGSYTFDGYWLDIGREEDFRRAQAEADRVLAGTLPKEPTR